MNLTFMTSTAHAKVAAKHQHVFAQCRGALEINAWLTIVLVSFTECSHQANCFKIATQTFLRQSTLSQSRLNDHKRLRMQCRKYNCKGKCNHTIAIPIYDTNINIENLIFLHCL